MESLQGEFNYINGGMCGVGEPEPLRETLWFSDVTRMSATGELMQGLSFF